MTDEHLHDTDSLNSFPYKDCTPTIVAVPPTPINGNSPSVCGDYLEIGVLPSNDTNNKTAPCIGQQQSLQNNELAPTIIPIGNCTNQQIPSIAENIITSNVISQTSFSERLQEIDDKIESWNNEEEAVERYPVPTQNDQPTNVFGEEFAAAVAGNDPIYDDEPMHISRENDVPQPIDSFPSSSIDNSTTVIPSEPIATDSITDTNIEPNDQSLVSTETTTEENNGTTSNIVDGEAKAIENETPPVNKATKSVRFQPYNWQFPSSFSTPPLESRSRPRKKRRRIVQLNDDSDSDDAKNDDRDQLLNENNEQNAAESCSENDDEAKSPTLQPLLDGDGEQEEKERTPSPTLETLEELVQKEKPGPKSKKASTQMIKEFQARALLKAAIVIPLTSGDNKRRKKRIIDDSDDEPECDVSMDVEGIGMPDTLDDDDENDDQSYDVSSILLIENDQIDDNDDDEDGVEAVDAIDSTADKLDTADVAIGETENPISSPQHDDRDDGEEQTNYESESNKEEDPDPVGERTDDTPVDSEEPPAISSTPASPAQCQSQKESENEINKDETLPNANADPIILKPISELLDPNRITNTTTDVDADVDPINIPHDLPDEIIPIEVCQITTDTNALASTLIVASSPPPKPTAAPKPKPVRKIINPGMPFAISSTSSEEEDIPNELYFGTPDLTQLFQQARNRANMRARGRPVPSSSSSRPHTMTHKTNVAKRGTNTARRGRAASNSQRGRQRSPSSSSSSSSDSDSSDTNRRKKVAVNRQQKVIHIVPRYQPMIPGRPPQQRIKQEKKKRKRDIPNDIYFGEVQVPLHVLHSYGAASNSASSSSDSDSEDDAAYIRQQQKYINMQRGRGRGITVTHISPPSKSSGRSSTTPKRPIGRPPQNKSHSGGGGHRESLLSTMKKYLRVAGLKKVNFKQLWEDCKSPQDRIDRIVQLLREQGLEGEPTMTKCRQLRKEISAKKEIEDLDPNLIIQAEGRTRRSVARAATRRNYTYEGDDNAQTTMLKLKKVIDSDSDID